MKVLQGDVKATKTFARTEDFAGLTDESIEGILTSEAGSHVAHRGGSSRVKGGVRAKTLQHTFIKDSGSYRAGLFGWYSKSWKKEETAFCRPEYRSPEGKYDLISEEGALDLEGVLVDVHGESTLYGKKGVHLPAAIAKNRHTQYTSTWWGASYSSLDETQEIAQVADILGGKKVNIISPDGRVTGQGASFYVPKLYIDGEKGIYLGPVRLQGTKIEETGGLRVCLFGINLLDPFAEIPSFDLALTVGFKTDNKHTTSSWGQSGKIQSDELHVRTEKGAQAKLRGTHLLGYLFTNDTIERLGRLISETDELLLGGSRFKTSTSTASASVSFGVDIWLLPTAGFSVGAGRYETDGFNGAIADIEHFENRRHGATVSIADGVQGGFSSASGETFKVVVDHTQTITSQRSGHGGFKVGSDGFSLSGGGSWGSKRSSDGTNFIITDAPNMVSRQDVVHEDSDTRAGVSASFGSSFDFTKMAAGFSFQIRDYTFGLNSQMISAFTNPASLLTGRDTTTPMGILEAVEGYADFGRAAGTVASNAASIAGLAGENVGLAQEILGWVDYALSAPSQVRQAVKTYLEVEERFFKESPSSGASGCEGEESKAPPPDEEGEISPEGSGAGNSLADQEDDGESSPKDPVVKTVLPTDGVEDDTLQMSYPLTGDEVSPYSEYDSIFDALEISSLVSPEEWGQFTDSEKHHFLFGDRLGSHETWNSLTAEQQKSRAARYMETASDWLERGRNSRAGVYFGSLVEGAGHGTKVAKTVGLAAGYTALAAPALGLLAPAAGILLAVAMVEIEERLTARLMDAGERMVQNAIQRAIPDVNREHIDSVTGGVRATVGAAALARSIKKTASPSRAGTKAERTLKHSASEAPGTSSHAGLYDPHKVRAEYEAGYPGKVTSTTVPGADTKNVKLAGTRHETTRTVFDRRGLPIFDDVAKFDTKIPREISSIENAARHKRAATRQLKEAIQGGYVSATQFSSEQLSAIQRGKACIPGLRWHHHQDVGRMQLVPEYYHDKTGHVGGMTMWPFES